MSKIRRAIMVWGAIMEDGNKITTDDENVVSVKIFPDGHVETTDPSGNVTVHEGLWVSYNPRFN